MVNFNVKYYKEPLKGKDFLQPFQRTFDHSRLPLKSANISFLTEVTLINTFLEVYNQA